MTNQSPNRLPPRAVDVLADDDNATFDSRQEATEAYVAAVHRMGASHLQAELLASATYKIQGLPE